MKSEAATHLAKAAAYLTDEGALDAAWLQRAIEESRRGIELDPAAGDGYLLLGRAYRFAGRLREEKALWERRLELVPGDADASERLGWILWFTGDGEAAVPLLRTAIDAAPHGRWARFYLGNALLSLGAHDAAEAAYRSALETHPDHSSAQAGLVWTLFSAGKDVDAHAELVLFREGAFDGDRIDLKLADLEYFCGEDDHALQHARRALDEPEERYWPRGLLASTVLGALLSSSDPAEAEEQLQASERYDAARLERGDEGFMPLVDLAAVASLRGDAREAARRLRAATGAGWRSEALVKRDRLFRAVRT